MFHPFKLVLAVAGLALSATTASADPYSAIYVFGDSLSDRGNLAEAFGSPFPDPPSYHYSFTNGPTAISLVANSFGLSADPSLWLTGFADSNGLFSPDYVPGTSYAVGGATAQPSTGNGTGAFDPASLPHALAEAEGIDGINLPDQLAAYLGHAGGAADPDALYTIFIGGNDIRGATLPGGGGAVDIQAGVASELSVIEALKSAGATRFLIINVPDVGEIPQFGQEHPDLVAEATANTLLYNSLLAAGVNDFEAGGGVDVTFFDLHAFNANILANAANYGITNVTDFCYKNAPFDTSTTAACGANAENIDSFAYWNDVHPTQQVHKLWADGISSVLLTGPQPAVPEPASWAMMIVGLGAVGYAMRRKRPVGLHFS